MTDRVKGIVCLILIVVAVLCIYKVPTAAVSAMSAPSVSRSIPDVEINTPKMATVTTDGKFFTIVTGTTTRELKPGEVLSNADGTFSVRIDKPLPSPSNCYRYAGTIMTGYWKDAVVTMELSKAKEY
jgi:hypothetical protein